MTTAIFMGLGSIAAAMHQGNIKVRGMAWITVTTDLCIIAALIRYVFS